MVKILELNYCYVTDFLTLTIVDNIENQHNFYINLQDNLGKVGFFEYDKEGNKVKKYLSKYVKKVTLNFMQFLINNENI